MDVMAWLRLTLSQEQGSPALSFSLVLVCSENQKMSSAIALW